MRLKQTEKQIEIQILQMLRLCNVFCWKMDRQGTFDPKLKSFRTNRNPFKIKGVSDILGILPNGQFLAIEVKSEKGKLSKEQQAFLDNVKLNGGVGVVAKNISQVVEGLREQLKNNKRFEMYQKEFGV